MEKGEYPISNRMREVLESYPTDSSRQELISTLDVIVSFLNFDEEIMKSLPPKSLENLITHLQPFKRLPQGTQRILRQEMAELEELLLTDPSLALTRAMDNFQAVRAEYKFIPQRPQK